MKHLSAIALAAILQLSAASVASADVRVTMHDGLVTIAATDVTIRQILAEWARVGQVTIINGDRISGGPISLEITNKPEKEALDILLRAINGYLAVPRATPAPNAARFDRIMVMPAAAQARSLSSAPPPLMQQQQQQPFRLQPLQPEFEDNPTFTNPNVAGEPARQPAQFSPVVPGGVQQTPVSTPAGRGATPTAATPTGSSVPGVILPPPTPPNQQQR